MIKVLFYSSFCNSSRILYMVFLPRRFKVDTKSNEKINKWIQYTLLFFVFVFSFVNTWMITKVYYYCCCCSCYYQYYYRLLHNTVNNNSKMTGIEISNCHKSNKIQREKNKENRKQTLKQKQKKRPGLWIIVRNDVDVLSKKIKNGEKNFFFCFCFLEEERSRKDKLFIYKH